MITKSVIHLLLENEPAWDRFVSELRSFLGTDQKLRSVGAQTGSLREEAGAELTSPRPGEPAVGDRIGNYEVLEVIGSGGMGKVYRAKHPVLDRDVAVKALVDVEPSDDSRLRRFEREARLLARLSHPNIALVYDFVVAEDRPYLIHELVEGETLADRVSRGPVPIDDVLDIGLQIVAAVEEAHRNGTVHRDLKPANVKLTPEGRVKVLDFGLAKLSSSADAEEQPTRHRFTTHTTQTGTVLGTPGYTSPEQSRGDAADARTDVWAFGCLIYEMLTGAVRGSDGFRNDRLGAPR